MGVAFLSLITKWFIVVSISLQTEPKLLPQVEEVTYAEPVLLPQPPNPNKMHQPPMGSPKSTLRKPMMGHHHGGVNSETLFQVRFAILIEK